MSRIQPLDVSPIPITTSTDPTTTQLGNSLAVAITLNQTVTSNTQVNIDTNYRSLLIPPTGSWPSYVTVLSGHNSVTFTINTQGTTGATAAFGACPGNEDAGNHSNWTASCSIALLTPPS